MKIIKKKNLKWAQLLISISKLLAVTAIQSKMVMLQQQTQHLSDLDRADSLKIQQLPYKS
jgi:hypothetical protein